MHTHTHTHAHACTHTHTHTHTHTRTHPPSTHTHTHTQLCIRAMGLKKRFGYNAHNTPHMNISPGVAVVRVCLAIGSTHRLVLHGTLTRRTCQQHRMSHVLTTIHWLHTWVCTAWNTN